MIVSCSTYHKGTFNIANFYLADLATIMRWGEDDADIFQKEIENVFQRHQVTLFNIEPPSSLEGEEITAYFEGQYQKAPSEYFFIEGMRAPKKRNKNILLCLSFIDKGGQIIEYESVQDINTFKPTFSNTRTKTHSEASFSLWSKIERCVENDVALYTSGRHYKFKKVNPNHGELSIKGVAV